MFRVNGCCPNLLTAAAMVMLTLAVLAVPPNGFAQDAVTCEYPNPGQPGYECYMPNSSKGAQEFATCCASTCGGDSECEGSCCCGACKWRYYYADKTAYNNCLKDCNAAALLAPKEKQCDSGCNLLKSDTKPLGCSLTPMQTCSQLVKDQCITVGCKEKDPAKKSCWCFE